MPPLQLDLVQTQELIEELKRRYPTLIVAGMTNWNDANSFSAWSVHGDYANCLMLLKLLEYRMVKDYFETSNLTDEVL